MRNPIKDAQYKNFKNNQRNSLSMMSLKEIIEEKNPR